jgi:hypothetical protein
MPDGLYLGPNALTGSISTFVGKLRSLNHLYLNDCYLTGLIPDEVGTLSNLGTSMLVASGNTTAPKSDCCFGVVGALALQNNALIGSLPMTITQLSNIGECFRR